MKISQIMKSDVEICSPGDNLAGVVSGQEITSTLAAVCQPRRVVAEGATA